MKSTIEQLTRQLYIVNRLLRSVNPVPTDVLLEDIEFQCRIREFAFPDERKSRMRLLQRDIKAIDEMFYITITHKSGQGYFVSSHDADSPMDYERFIADFDLLSSISPDSEVHKYVLAERNRFIGSDNFSTLLNAIKEHRRIEFNYTNIRTGNIRHHVVSPYFLKEDQMRWYLISFETNGSMMVFAIERMTDLTVLDETFKRNSEIEAKNLFRDSYGIWDDQKVKAERVVLKYDSLDGSFLKSVPLHPSQTILCDNDSEFVIELNIKITNDFVMALLSRARSLEVISPLHLRQRIHDVLEQAALRNKYHK